MKFLTYLLLAVIALSTFSCREDFKFEASQGKLAFSKDTVYLDTVFSNIGSSTYTLKVYNKSTKDIKIPSIRLANGETSNYRLMVDGLSGKQFNNVELLAKDSLFIFIETTIDYQQYQNSETTFLYTDKIEFDYGVNYQKVDLVTLVQDAIFLYPNRNEDGSYEYLPYGEDRIYGFFLDENDPINGNELHFTNEKPYVIYGYAAVPPNKTLQIDPGTKIHFHDSSGIMVAQNGSIQAIGTLDNPIKIEGNRLEPSFEDRPGQWGTIWLTSGSINNKIEHTIIKNGVVGLLVQNSPLVINNTQIYNCVNAGILAQTGNIIGSNVVINNAGQSSLACTYGGNYHFTHSTFANYWNQSGRSLPAVLIDNTGETVDGFLASNTRFDNCIIYGSNSIELLLNKAHNSTFENYFNHCLIKFIDVGGRYANNALYNFNNEELFNNCLIARTSNSNKVDFINYNKNDLRIKESSTAKGNADWQFSSGSNDILGNTRTQPSDIGAYNFVVEE